MATARHLHGAGKPKWGRLMSLPKVSKTRDIAHDPSVPCELEADTGGGLVMKTPPPARAAGGGNT